MKSCTVEFHGEIYIFEDWEQTNFNGDPVYDVRKDHCLGEVVTGSLRKHIKQKGKAQMKSAPTTSVTYLDKMVQMNKMMIDMSAYISPSRTSMSEAQPCGYAPCCNQDNEEIEMTTDLQTTRSYLADRLHTTMYDKQSDARVFFTEEPDLTPKQKVEALKAGKFTLTKNAERALASAADDEGDYYSLSDFISLRETPADYTAYHKACSDIEAAKLAAKDIVMASDEATGLKTLQDFQSKTFH